MKTSTDTITGTMGEKVAALPQQKMIFFYNFCKYTFNPRHPIGTHMERRHHKSGLEARLEEGRSPNPLLTPPSEEGQNSRPKRYGSMRLGRQRQLFLRGGGAEEEPCPPAGASS